MDARPEPTVAPNGVELYSHPFAGGVVRGESEASYEVEGDGGRAPLLVRLEAGAVWVTARRGGWGVVVVAGGMRIEIEDGSAVVDAGFSGEGLVLVVAGRVDLVESTGATQSLVAGNVGVLDVDGTVAAVDNVDDEELGADRWVVANIGLDAAMAQAEPDSEGPAIPVPVPIPVTEPEPEAEPDDTSEPYGEAAGAGDPTTISESSEASDLPYASADGDDDKGSAGRRYVRVLEVVLLVVVVAVGALIIALVNRNEPKDAGPVSIDSPISVVAESSTTKAPSTIPRSTTTAPTTPTTTGKPTTVTAGTAVASTTPSSTAPASSDVKTTLRTCTAQSDTQLVASGTAEGANAAGGSYEIEVGVTTAGGDVLGKTTVRAAVAADGSKVPWQADITVSGDVSGASCEVLSVAVV